MKKLLFFCGVAALVIGCQSKTEEETPAPSNTSAGMSSTAETEVTFASIQPILNDNCIKCHSEGGKAGVDLRTFDSVMKGGEDGVIVKPGDPDHSDLIHVLYGRENHPQMPFKMDPLPKEEIDRIEGWVKGGAKA